MHMLNIIPFYISPFDLVSGFNILPAKKIKYPRQKKSNTSFAVYEMHGRKIGELNPLELHNHARAYKGLSLANDENEAREQNEEYFSDLEKCEIESFTISLKNGSHRCYRCNSTSLIKEMKDLGWFDFTSAECKEIRNKIQKIKEDKYLTEAKAYTKKYFSKHIGNISDAPLFVHTFKDADNWLNDFLRNRFEKFGIYEDAIVAKETVLYHSILSPMLNIGLLTPKQVIDKALAIGQEKNIPLNSLEGFIRQIIGWREFTEGHISTHFYAIQSFHLAMSSSYLNGEDWTKQFISKLLQITHSQWIFHNFSLHDKTHSYLHNKKADEILHLINEFSEVAPEEVPEDS